MDTWEKKLKKILRKKTSDKLWNKIKKFDSKINSIEI